MTTNRYYIEPGTPENTENALLVKFAKEASVNAKCHISKFRVGAAVLTRSGSVYLGCNMESDTHTMCLHAESNALGSMVVAGEKTPVKIAVFTYDSENLWWPCGICRQVIGEICGDDMIIIACSDGVPYRTTTLGEIFPEAFRSRDPWTGDKIEGIKKATGSQ